MRGSQHVHEAVRAWECDSIEDSPMTAKRETMSNLQPESLPFLPIGNHFDILTVLGEVSNAIGVQSSCAGK